MFMFSLSNTSIIFSSFKSSLSDILPTPSLFESLLFFYISLYFFIILFKSNSLISLIVEKFISAPNPLFIKELL